MERNNGLEGFSGKLHNFPLLDVIQMGCLAQRDGRFRVRRHRDSGEIVLQGGRIIHAVTKRQVGEPALLEVLGWRKGVFEFVTLESGKASPPRTIFGGWEQVLMDAVRQRDEQQNEEAGLKELPLISKQDAVAQLLQRIAIDNRRRRRLDFIRRTLFFVILAIFAGGICWVVGGAKLPVGSWFAFADKKIEHALGHQIDWQRRTPTEVLIPAGVFSYQDGQQTYLPAFNIDSTEVTVWQYQEFLDATGNDTRYDHPNQRVGKGHSNPSWRAYADAAFSFGEMKGIRLNPNFPAAYLDWFDAYAFAKWERRRLPSEVEWEKAGRGSDGRKYPWGTQFLAGAANLYGALQRTASWSEVGRYSLDISPYGIHDLAGNVSEWTGSDDGNGSPVVRGGNFMGEDGGLTRRVIGLSPYTIDERIGFRTAGEEPH